MKPEKKEAEKILNDFINILCDDSVGKAYAKDCAIFHVKKLIDEWDSVNVDDVSLLFIIDKMQNHEEVLKELELL